MSVLALTGIVVAAILYHLGTRRLEGGRSRRERPWRAQSFYAGLVALAVAIAPPLDGLADRLFWAHMVQHALLQMVAPPLIVLGAPVARALAAPVARRAAADEPLAPALPRCGAAPRGRARADRAGGRVGAVRGRDLAVAPPGCLRLRGRAHASPRGRAPRLLRARARSSGRACSTRRRSTPALTRWRRRRVPLRRRGGGERARRRSSSRRTARSTPPTRASCRDPST